jgi:hypothetical protein
MNRILFVASAAVVCGALGARVSFSDQGTAGTRMVEAAQALWGSLSEAQQKTAGFDYASFERFNWHFIPRDRKGLPLKDLSAEQRGKLDQLLQAALSPDGFKVTHEVMQLESVLREIEGPNRRFPRDPDLYYLTFFGKPSARDRWGWRFEGHHISLNFALEGGKVSSTTPMVYGANPALVREGPKQGLRVLAGTEDLARALAAMLDPAQLQAAQGEPPPDEILGTESYRYNGPFPAGLVSDRMSAEQKGALRKLIREYTSRLAADVAAQFEKRLDLEGLKDVRFAWRGGLKAGEGHGYMVHGPSFVVSYANFQNNAYHVHSGLRTLDGELGVTDR